MKQRGNKREKKTKEGERKKGKDEKASEGKGGEGGVRVSGEWKDGSETKQKPTERKRKEKTDGLQRGGIHELARCLDGPTRIVQCRSRDGRNKTRPRLNLR